MRTATLRPGLLVSLKTSVRGGVEYTRTDLEAAKERADGAIESRWETQKRIEDPAEFERATVTRNAARRMISKVCASSDFGLLCPSDRETELAKAIEEARQLARLHNENATRTQIEIFCIAGRIAQDDAEAQRAINSEIRGLISEMEEGIKAADPERIRKAANVAKGLGTMLTEDAGRKVSAMIEEARAAAREIVKRVQKEGETAATVVAECKVEALNAARFAFLDYEEPKPVEALPIVASAAEVPTETCAEHGGPVPCATCSETRGEPQITPSDPTPEPVKTASVAPWQPALIEF
jgi:hypothetical protein